MTDRQMIGRLWRDYIRPQAGRLALAFAFMLLLAVATAAYTWVISQVVDGARELGATQTQSDALGTAKRYAVIVLPLLIGIPLISGVANYIQRILTNSIALHAVGRMQKQMLAATHAGDFEQLTSEPIGNRISKFVSDIGVVSASLVRVLGNLIRDVLTVIFTAAAMLWQNWQLSLVMVCFGLALWPIIEISKKMRGNAKDVQEHVGQITSELKESFGGARMVKAYGLETHEQARLGASFDTRIKLFLRLVTQQARVDPIMEILGGLVIAGVVVFGVYQVGRDSASPGQIAAVLGGILILAPRLRALGTLNNVIQEGLSSLARIFNVIDETPTLMDKTGATDLNITQGDVRFTDVSFHYHDGSRALDKVSLTALAGKTTALVGPSGGGKSTLMNLVPRLYDVTEGAVTIDGQDVRDVSQASLRQNIALVSQDVTLFNTTIAANIAFGLQGASHIEIQTAAKAADAHGFISKLPKGYDTVLGEDGAGLSGGQKQRLSIARAILRDAPILLLDEATSALDAESEAKVQTALTHLSQGRTTLVIAHRLSTVQSADKIYVLDKGRVIESGTDKTLRTKGGVYAGLRDLQ